MVCRGNCNSFIPVMRKMNRNCAGRKCLAQSFRPLDDCDSIRVKILFKAHGEKIGRPFHPV